MAEPAESQVLREKQAVVTVGNCWDAPRITVLGILGEDGNKSISLVLPIEGVQPFVCADNCLKCDPQLSADNDFLLVNRATRALGDVEDLPGR